MRIHTNGIEHAETIRKALYSKADRANQVSIEVIEYGSKSHRKAFEVLLQGHGERHRKNDMSHTRKAATRDDWGHFLAALYDIDSTIKAGPYRDRADFRSQTRNEYS